MIILVAKARRQSDLKKLEYEIIEKMDSMRFGLNRLNPVRKDQKKSAKTAKTGNTRAVLKKKHLQRLNLEEATAIWETDGKNENLNSKLILGI